MLGVCALLGGCMHVPSLASLAPDQVDPRSPIAAEVRTAEDTPGPYPHLSNLPVIPTDVRPAQAAAKVILNARTGSIVMNQMVTLDSCAVAHGNLSVVVNTQTVVSQPGAFSNGQTVAARQSQIQLKQDNGALRLVTAGANLAEVVKALNALGATPADLMSILQAMKAAGALRAELEII